MRIIIANYRYFIAGGPEKYMFKFMDAAEKMGIEVIPFSVNNSQNEKTPYSKYFAKPRSNQLMYADTKKSISNLIGMVRATVWNYDAKKCLRQLIRDTKPDAVYILHEVNHLSPSIIRAAKKEGVRVVHRISDFFMFCPKYDFLCENEICEACLHGDYRKAIEHRCVKGSKAGTLLRVLIPCILAGLRADTIGTDVKVYVEPMYNAAKKSHSLSTYMNQRWFVIWRYMYVNKFEIGFSLMVFLVQKLGGSFALVLFFIQLLIVAPIYIGLRKIHKP